MSQTPAPAPPTASPTAAASSSSSFSLIFIPPTAPAGVASITNPPQTATPFYKIAPGQPITFGWSFSGVIQTPTRLTVSAVCDNGNTYPVGPTDGVIPGTATEVVWDPYEYNQRNPQKPLAVGSPKYTLNIYDERGLKGARRPGYLQPNTGLNFGLYTPRPYVALADGWTCETCNGAMATVAHPAFVSLVVTFLVVFFSGFHLLRSSSRSAGA
ncbi:hypothetical protein D9619_011349 [Psilocybe cf. subviscida]|uniref:DUF7137 domain-containing protein n=1 Tax=Psilocybe cf. subviscida TaxID=2480587 RepID=A0A8H5BL88_9AGAR|nr:hypothetical protein D9619_011349 [Psilocybe cf. subviscida]